jgi:hypothetical protein
MFKKEIEDRYSISGALANERLSSGCPRSALNCWKFESDHRAPSEASFYCLGILEDQCNDYIVVDFCRLDRYRVRHLKFSFARFRQLLVFQISSWNEAATK